MPILSWKKCGVAAALGLLGGLAQGIGRLLVNLIAERMGLGWPAGRRRASRAADRVGRIAKPPQDPEGGEDED